MQTSGQKRWHGGGVDIAARLLQQRFHHRIGTRDKGTADASSLAQRTDVDDAIRAQAERLQHTAPFAPQHTETMCIVDHQPGVMLFAQFEHLT